MAGRTLDIEGLISPENLASEIARYWSEWNGSRQKWLQEKQELRNYVFATDTKTTQNNKLPWSNSTTVPKLTQIRDNLHANYFAALFPNSDWLTWLGDDGESNAAQKVEVIQAYMGNKLRKIAFEETVSQLLYDYIDWGMVIARVDYQTNYTQLADGQNIPGYIGPVVHRISPYDIVFNPVAPSYRETPKIVREIKTLGDLHKEVSDNPQDVQLAAVLAQIENNRTTVNSLGDNQLRKSDAFIADGFGSISQYYKSGYVEILTFYGDLYDSLTRTFYKNHIIRVIDRAYIVSMETNPSWLGRDPIHIAGWRSRPDNLYPMGPLDNLVGLQYRLDHLENLRADIFDQIALPVLKIRGDVEDFEYQPGARIFLGDEGDVSYLNPDSTALNADFQIDRLEMRMEELAGAPKTAMGIRTPGEKTAFEVQSLQNAASRIFQHKTAQFERTFLEPLLNSMLEIARRNLNVADTVRVLDNATGAVLFRQITQEDITATGRIVPIGARHFAERARRVQNLSMLSQMRADPTVGAHLSGKEIARILSEELNEPRLFAENITLLEQQETARMAEEAAVGLETERSMAAETGLF